MRWLFERLFCLRQAPSSDLTNTFHRSGAASSEPLVSVVIPFFNRVDRVLRAVFSVQNQTYRNFEIILIDDGSTEDTSRVMTLVSISNNTRLFNLKSNCGPAAARNTGIDESRGQYLAFLDSDDTWDARKLEVQIHWMIRHKYLATHTSYMRLDEDTEGKNSVDSGRKDYTFPLIAFSCKIATPTVIVDRESVGDLRFVADVRYGEDTVFWINLAKKLGPIRGIPVVLANVYVNRGSASRDPMAQACAARAIQLHGLKGNTLLGIGHQIYTGLKLHVKRYAS